MPYPSITFADFLTPATRQEFEQYASLVQGYLSEEHDETGAHTHITAQSLTVEDTASIGDDLEVGNGSIVISEQGGDAPAGNGGVGPGIRFNADPASATPGAWDLFVDTGRVDNLQLGYFLFRHAQRDRSIAGFRYDSDAGSEVYCFVPHDDIKETGGGEVNLGSDQDGSNQGWFNKAYVEEYFHGNHRTLGIGAWTTFSPTWTNLTVGNGTVVARYARVNNIVQFWIRVAFGTTSSIGGVVSVTIPVNMHASLAATSVRIGDCSYRDNSAGQQYWGGALANGADKVALFDNASPCANVNTTVPFAWAQDDVLFVTGRYEAA